VKYQSNYTENPVAREKMYDEEGRVEKARKIVAVLDDFCENISELSILDVSCSTGLIPGYFSSYFNRVTGIDIDAEAVGFARANNNARNVEFHVMDALQTDFGDDSFDIIVCNQMYEHVPDAEQLLREIRRILVPGGVCYFGATNRLKVIETHYGRLPFLSWLPKPLANLYLRMLGRGSHYYENLYTYWTLKRLCAEFEVTDYTTTVVREPERFGVEDMIRPGSPQQRIVLTLLRMAYWISPGYIWILRKPAGQLHSGSG
jgi:2-polyprenyl-3-methyl-5-hydroxy-6-metoxy-1,4-benzoquinol methylase